MEENIYQELKSDFKKSKSDKKSNYLIYFWAVVLIVCIYFFTHTGNFRAREVSKSIDSLLVDWEKVELSDVKIMKIPQEVYDSMEIDPSIPQEAYNQMDRSREQYLLWDKKRILLITWDGCPYARRFRKELDNVFDKNAYLTRYYDKYIKETWQYVTLSCLNGYDCASIWLFENCWEWICIINPMAKEVIVDTSQKTAQILPLLKSYDTWDDRPLLK